MILYAIVNDKGEWKQSGQSFGKFENAKVYTSLSRAKMALRFYGNEESKHRTIVQLEAFRTGVEYYFKGKVWECQSSLLT